MVADMYRFVLKVKTSTGGGTTTDAKGHIVDVLTTDKIIEIPCLYSANSQGRFIASEDGSAKVYNFVISMPLGYPFLYRGQAVEIYDGDMLMQKGRVEMFNPGLMDAKAWI